MRASVPLAWLLIGCKPVLSVPAGLDTALGDTAIEADADADADTDADTDSDTDADGDADTDDPCSYEDLETSGKESYTDVGVVCLPATFYGELESVGHDEGEYTGDYDFLRFQVPTSDGFEVELDWSASGSDYDLYVFRASDFEKIARAEDQVAQPELVEVSLNAGVYYYVAVVGYDGSPGAWWVTLDR